MTVKNALVAVLGNKSDSESFFEADIDNMTFNVR